MKNTDGDWASWPGLVNAIRKLLKKQTWGLEAFFGGWSDANDAKGPGVNGLWLLMDSTSRAEKATEVRLVITMPMITCLVKPEMEVSMRPDGWKDGGWKG